MKLWVHYQDEEPMALMRQREASPAELLEAARPHADLEAAFEVYANQRPGVGPVTDRKRVEAIVLAALGAVDG